jgi:hypothetical protein
LVRHRTAREVSVCPHRYEGLPEPRQKSQFDSAQASGLALLRAISREVWQTPETRRASQQAAARIEAVTREWKDLPRPAAPPVPADGLPRAGAASAPSVDHLPAPFEAKPEADRCGRNTGERSTSRT